MQFALSQVQGRLAAARGSLPDGLDLSAERLTPSVFPMLQYQLTGADPLVLHDLAEFTVRPRLAGLPDVGEVAVDGGRVREIAVQLDPARLMANGVSVDQVAQAIGATDMAEAAGRTDRDYRQYAIIVSGLTNTPDAVGRVVVRQSGARPVRVADLGTVGYGAQDLFQIVAGNGRPAALVNISRQPNGNTLRLQAAVRATMDSIRPLLPAGVRLEAVYDQAALVRDSIGSVRDAMLLGGALAVLVLLLFLGEWRTTAAAALSLPLTVAITLLGLALTGDSLNLMSLGGLAVAIGIIIDDAVVVVENIERRLALHPDEPPAEVVRTGTDEIFGPVAGSTLTTVVVFAPLGLLTGVVGEFFRSFAIALAVAVLLSLVLAMTLIPAVVAQWAARTDHRADDEPARRRLPRLSLRPLEERYARAIGWMLGHRGVAVGACAALLALGLGLSRVIGTGFLPEMDEGGFILDYWAPTGAALTETDRQVRVLEGILLADPAVQAFTRRTGSELGFAATSPNRGDFTVLLKPRGQRPSVYAGDGPGPRGGGGAGARGAGGVRAAHAGRDRRPGRRARAGRAQAVQPRPGRGRARGRGRWRRRSSRRPAWWTCSTACRATTRSAGSSSIRRGSRGWGSRPPRSRPRPARRCSARTPARRGSRTAWCRSGCGCRTACAPGRRARAGADRSDPAAGSRSGSSARCATPAARASCCGRTCGPTSR